MIVVENHYLGSVLDQFQFDTFYHEHPRTYSLTSFTHIARSLGFQLTGVEFPARYGGNIRVFIGGPQDVEYQTNSTAIIDILSAEQQFGNRLLKMQESSDLWNITMRQQVTELMAEHGKLSAKAFPGRAAILIKLLGLDSSTIDAVYEKPGSMKIGHYIPGTRIPIHSDDDFWAMSNKPAVMLNLAWHISSEIRSYLEKHGYSGQVIDILDPSILAAY